MAVRGGQQEECRVAFVLASLQQLRALEHARSAVMLVLFRRAGSPSASTILEQSHSFWTESDAPTFSDTLAAVRRELWQVVEFPMSAPSTDTIQIQRAFLDRLRETLS